MEWRKLKIKDMKKILEFENEHSPGMPKYATFSKESLEYIFDNPSTSAAYGLFDGDNLVGVGIYRDGKRYYPDKDGTFEICSIIVHKDERKEGYGKKVLNQLLQEIKNNQKPRKIFLTVSPLNKPALILYTKNDFIVCGYKEKSWGNNPRIIMKLSNQK